MTEKKVHRANIEDGKNALRALVNGYKEKAADLLIEECRLVYWDLSLPVGQYMAATNSAVNSVVRYLYCCPEASLSNEIDTVRRLIETRREEALSVRLEELPTSRILNVQKYFFSLAALELVLDGTVNPEPLEKLWRALELDHARSGHRLSWEAVFDGAVATNYVIFGLVGKVLMGEGQAVIDFMAGCPEERKVGLETESSDLEEYKVIYFTALRQMKIDPQDEAFWGQRAHSAFYGWNWLNRWKDYLPGNFTLLFMLWAAIRKANGDPMEPAAIMRSIQPEPICNLFLDAMGS